MKRSMSLEKTRILFVEDDPSHARLIIDIIEIKWSMAKNLLK
ncbi:MAG: hypothetical protein SCARUB_04431 [Candidatus Scalindua rubra]|uniref:Uncharacterized protein n=1 Tax=Candidatus Scalindua rubra TaxID=1872076 RepID=A0A1E3X467_9BACT|nr:MAG: hypothetical protein SCARUB_04431 [Candidatus Scalindua rubra]